LLSALHGAALAAFAALRPATPPSVWAYSETSPDKTNGCPSPTWADAVLVIVAVPIMPVVMVVVMVVVVMMIMVVIFIVRVMLMVVIMIVIMIMARGTVIRG
jgi:hypothetical protein